MTKAPGALAEAFAVERHGCPHRLVGSPLARVQARGALACHPQAGSAAGVAELASATNKTPWDGR